MNAIGRRTLAPGLCALLGAVLPACSESSPEAPGAYPRTVLVVAVDELRSEALGAARPHMPELASLVEEGTLFTGHLTSSTAINAALASLFTGLPPHEHGLRSLSRLGRHRLREGPETLAELFASRGSTCIGAVSIRQLEGRLSGLDRGFHVWRDEGLPRGGGPLPAATVLARLQEELARAFDEEAAVFAFLQLGDLRVEVEPPALLELRSLRHHLEPLRDRDERLDELLETKASPEELVGQLRALLERRRGSPEWKALRRASYAARLLALDERLGELFGFLHEHERLDDAWIALVGTRGTYLHEPRPHGAAEGFSEGLIRTPLLLRMPGVQAPQRIEEPVDSTILAAILRSLEVQVAAGPARVFSPRVGAQALVDAEWKLIERRGEEPLAVRRADEKAFPITEVEEELRARLEPLLAALPLHAPIRVGLSCASEEIPCADLRVRAPTARGAGQLFLAAPGEHESAELESAPSDVPLILDLSRGGQPLPEEEVSIAGLGPLLRAPVPRMAPVDSPRYPSEGPPWIVDVARSGATGWSIRVEDPQRDAAGSPIVRVYAVPYPPGKELEWPPLGAGIRRLDQGGLGGGFVLEGTLPFAARVPRPLLYLTLAVEIDGELVPAARMRYLGRSFLGTTLTLYLPAWLPERADWFVPGLELPDHQAERADLHLSIERFDPAPFPEGPIGLSSEQLRFLKRLGRNE